MGVGTAIADLVGRLSRQRRVLVNHYEELLAAADVNGLGLDEAVRQAVARGEIRLIESIAIDVAGDIRNFRFPWPRS